MWKSLHTAAFYTPGSPHHGASRQHWGQLVRLARPAPFRRTAARRRRTRQTAPHRKIPGTHSGMPGIFLFRFNGRHAGETLPISTAAAAEGGKLSLYGLLAGAGGLLTDPLVSGALPQGGALHRANRPHPKNPRHSLWNAGDFLSIYSCCTGVTSAHRSHGLPL